VDVAEVGVPPAGAMAAVGVLVAAAVVVVGEDVGEDEVMEVRKKTALTTICLGSVHVWKRENARTCTATE
jgi:hypothetical protein